MTTVEINDANFDSEVLTSNVPVLIDFWAEWCAPCKAIAPIVEEVASEYSGRLKVGKLDVDSSPGVAGRYGIRSIPTLLLFKDGHVHDTVVGAVPKTKMVEAVEKALS